MGFLSGYKKISKVSYSFWSVLALVGREMDRRLARNEVSIKKIGQEETMLVPSIYCYDFRTLDESAPTESTCSPI